MVARRLKSIQNTPVHVQLEMAPWPHFSLSRLCPLRETSKNSGSSPKAQDCACGVFKPPSSRPARWFLLFSSTASSLENQTGLIGLLNSTWSGLLRWWRKLTSGCENLSSVQTRWESPGLWVEDPPGEGVAQIPCLVEEVQNQETSVKKAQRVLPQHK